MAESLVPALTSIAEEEEVVFDPDAITDPARLKRLRTTAQMVHTNAGKKLLQSVRIGEDWDTVRAYRVVYVREFDSLEQHHDRYVRCNAPNCSTAGNEESAHVNGFKRRYSANVVLPGPYTDRSADYDIGKRSNSYVGSSSGPYNDCTTVCPADVNISRRSSLFISGLSVHAGDYSHHPRPDDQ
ncbi:hypothetical protein DAPPUDRAFT_323901 [Daphnia pulex]|uniref:Uncharacterized protein n=1 Tax=Daphnia pulex TaxID=6669 RepID=E9H045_DAPPU|nr:hypothetical protein DAPPUDRAFT_323901 [Daphnia pulex]|eukprot:EFX74927.1 hypothetical protein DAPPUDRAFT_323901 [Daphnia pulex]